MTKHLVLFILVYILFFNLQQSNHSDSGPVRKKSILQNPLTFEQQQQALQQAQAVEPITQQPTPANYGMLHFFRSFFPLCEAYLHPFVSTVKSLRLRIHFDCEFFSCCNV